MQHQSARAGLLFLALLLTVCFTAERATGSNSEPEQTYQKAWQLVSDNFYDTSFNHQSFEIWHHKYDGKLQNDSQAYVAIKTMLTSLGDPYTRFLDPRSSQEEGDAINSFVCGIGISLRPYAETHALIVNDVIAGGPAFQAGIVYGDQITAIDGTAATDIDTDKAAEKIRGGAGTPISLTIRHQNSTRVCQIVRAQVSIPAVTTKLLPNNIGYIKLSTFMSDDASSEFRDALQLLASSKGLIIDLRDNPGGLLANAVEIADMLIERGKIVSTTSRQRTTTNRCSGGALTNQPLVVLVDHDSASASEILAGALKDNGRATIVGTTTYGKGLVQEINRLPGGAGIHITVARYYTPSGSDINKIGIKPDISVPDRDKQLACSIEVLGQLIASAANPEPSALTQPTRSFRFNPRLLSPRS